jgi:ribosome biogenesis GTPase
MNNNVSVFTGHSGVGKTSLMNVLDESLKLRTSEISKQNEQGQHTTTFAEMFDLENGAKIIDSPGIKGFGLIDINKNELGGYFPEIANYSKDCKFNNCLHLKEPNCAVKLAVENNKISSFRYNNYLNILNDNQDNFRTNSFSE